MVFKVHFLSRRLWKARISASVAILTSCLDAYVGLIVVGLLKKYQKATPKTTRAEGRTTLT